MKTYQEFSAEAYNREYDLRGPRPVRGRDYEDFKGLPKPSGDLGGKFQGGWLKKKEEKKSKLPESAVPGKPAEKLGAVTAIPKDERQAALERIKAKTAAIRKKKGIVEDAELGEGIDELWMITPTAKKTTTKSQSKSKRDPYGEDPAVTRKKLAAKVKKLKEEGEIEEGIGMTVAGALGNPPALSKRMKLKRALIVREIEKNTEKNKKKKYSGKAKEEVNELFVTRKSPEQRADEKRKKKVAELIRLMKHAKDTHSDVSRKKVS